MKSKLEIIKETYEFYNLNPSQRAIAPSNNRCEYITEDGRMCAVGRCLVNPLKFDNRSINDDVFASCINSSKFSKKVLKNFKAEYQLNDPEFWYDLQQFHDTVANWTTNGITVTGKLNYNDLIEKYATD